MAKKLVEAITSMEEDFAQWYTDVVKKAELCGYTSVKGCMAIKPAGYAICRGIPVGIQPKMGIPAVTVVFTVLHAGGKFGGGGYKVSGGLHGVGASVVNALSEWLEVKVCDGENIYRQRYERGNIASDLEIIGKGTTKGTEITFKADPLIFTETDVYEYEVLETRLREQGGICDRHHQKGRGGYLCDPFFAGRALCPLGNRVYYGKTAGCAGRKYLPVRISRQQRTCPEADGAGRSVPRYFI